MNPRVEKALQKLKCYEKTHLKLHEDMFSGRRGAWYELDFLAVATLNRSLCLTTGFCTLIKARNFIAAVPLLRLQLDNLMRFSAAWLVDDPHGFAREVVNGTRIKDLKDRSGERMHDSYLKKICVKDYPQVSGLYENASDYIHLSNKHVFNAIQASKTGDGKFTAKVSAEDEYIPDETYLEAIQLFDATTKVLFSHFSRWIATKDHPQDIEKLRKSF
jgi:hypothetical protein